jgi:hypothetical protein
MLAWQGAKKNKLRRGGASSLAARWAHTKRKLTKEPDVEHTNTAGDARDHGPRFASAKPRATSLDMLDITVLRRLSDEQVLTLSPESSVLGRES